MFHKYPKIRQLGNEENAGVLDAPEDFVCIQEKMDGCFPYSAMIHTEKGLLPIGKVVNNKLPIKVLSVKNNKLCYRKIKKYYCHGKGNNWVKLRYNYFGTTKQIIVTDNHILFTDKGMKQIKEIDLQKDMLISRKYKLNSDQRNVLIGSILGDMSFRNMNHKTKNPMFTETHGEKQKKYSKWKAKILANFISKQDSYLSRYNDSYPLASHYRISSISTPAFKELSFLYDKNGKKKIPKDIGNHLCTLSLAVWFMDDGNTGYSKKQNPRAKFHTQGFSKKEVEYLKNGLLDTFNIESTIHNYNGWQIDLTTKGSATLYKLIAPYVPFCMHYKIPKKYRKYIFKEQIRKYNALMCMDIISIEKYNPASKQKYDIEVDDTHCYFVRDVLVHNSNFRFMFKEGRIIFGSRMTELGTEDDDIKGNWKRCVEHIKEQLKDKQLSEGHIYFGEMMVRHSISYDWEKVPPFLGFDVMNIESGEMLHPTKAREIFENYDLIFVPVLYEGLVKNIPKTLINGTEIIVPQSAYYDDQAEGIVIKNYHKQLMAKFVTEKFKEVNRETFGGSKKFEESDDGRIAAMYCTNPRIDKCIFKLIDAGEKLDMRLMEKLPKMVLEDIYEEHWKDICFSSWSLNFKNVRKKITQRCLKVLQQCITNNALNKEKNENE